MQEVGVLIPSMNEVSINSRWSQPNHPCYSISNEEIFGTESKINKPHNLLNGKLLIILDEQ